MRSIRRSKSNNRIIKKKYIFFLITMLIIFVIIFGIKVYFSRPQNSRYDNIIESAAGHNSIDPLLIKAVIWRESDFNPNAIGTKGEIGLMQLMMKSSVKDWANYTRRKMPERGVVFNPYLNIEIGTWYLAWCRKQWAGYRSMDTLALATYNAGYSNVKKWVPKNYQGDNVIELIKFPSTKKYISKIMEKYKEYKLERSEK